MFGKILSGLTGGAFATALEEQFINIQIARAKQAQSSYLNLGRGNPQINKTHTLVTTFTMPTAKSAKTRKVKTKDRPAILQAQHGEHNVEVWTHVPTSKYAGGKGCSKTRENERRRRNILLGRQPVSA